ncbi:MAG: glycoside hydrolase family 28 protein [Lachnospiraceae bacterium]
MKADVIFKTARSLVLEMKVKGCYNSEEVHEVYVNGVLAEKSDKIIVSLYDLLPDTDYEIIIVMGEQVSKPFTVHTETEFVTLNVKDFGAKGDGVTDDTLFIQCAINACPKNGRVFVPEGNYKITSLFLKSDLILEIGKDATLIAELDRTKFPILPGRIESSDEKEEYNLGTWEGNPLDCFAGIITGINVSNVIITGQGTIDGRAAHENWWAQPKLRRIAWRPRLVFLNHCTNVVMQGIQLKNSPSWNVHPYFSDYLRFIDLKILNPADSPNTDGLDPESCSNVEIVGVYFSLGDDCIAIKSGKIYMGAKYKRPSQNLMIRQCCMRDGHGSITIGSEMAGGVRNITVKDCKFLHTDRGLRIKTRRGRGKDAIIDGILFENIQMDHVMTPVVINAFYFCDPDGHSEYVQSKEAYPVDDRTPYLGELSFRHIKATNCHAAASYIYGLPEQKIKKVSFEDVSFSYAKEPKAGVPAMMDGAGKQTRLGLFAKNVELLELKQVEITGQDGDALITDGVDRMIRE